MAILTDKAALINRFGEKMLIDLTDRADPRTGEIVDSVLDAAIVTSSDFVLSFLRERYDVIDIEADVPAPVDDFVMDLVPWFLSKRPTEAIKMKYEAALRWLNLARKGQVTLGLNAAGNAPVSTAGPLYCAPERQITNSRLSGTYFRSSNPGDCK